MKKVINKPLLYQYFDAKADELLASFNVSAQQKASDNLGANREHFINQFLENVLPPRLTVKKSGEVLDHTGHTTGQIDILIIRDDAPGLDMGSQHTYLAEGVFAAIEVKSNLTVAKLKEAAKTLQAVENLQIQSPGIMSGPNLRRPLRLVFAYKGATFDTLTKAIVENGWEELFDLICILERGVRVTTGRLITVDAEEVAPELANYRGILFESKAASLGFLYLYLVTYAAGFSTGSMNLGPYFGTLSDWGR